MLRFSWEYFVSSLVQKYFQAVLLNRAALFKFITRCLSNKLLSEHVVYFMWIETKNRTKSRVEEGKQVKVKVHQYQSRI